MKSDADVQRDIEADAAYAASIRSTGGECRCGGDEGIFAVHLTDGRAFTRAALHGSGGVRRLPKPTRENATHELTRVLHDVARRWREDEPLILYLVHAYHGGERLPMAADQIASIEIHAGEVHVTVADCGYPRTLARGRHRGVRYAIVKEAPGAGLHWEIPSSDHLGRPTAPMTSSGRFDGCDDHPEGAIAWAEWGARTAIDKALGAEP